MWRTYHTSRLNFSSQLMALRPFTCAQPVRPGRTSWRWRCSSLYSGRYFTSRGRGPTMDMSPRRIFTSSGSSSRDVRRRALPKGGKRWSSGSSSPFSSRWSVMLRNLYRRKTFPPLPGRGCRKITGLPNLTRTRSAVISRTGDRTISASRERVKSKSRLMYFS